MPRPDHLPVLPSSRKGRCCLLALCYLAGLLGGIAVYASAAGTLASMMRRMGSVSVAVSLAGNLLPLLVCLVFPVGMVYPVCCYRAFGFAFVSLGLLHGFGSAGWLLRWIWCFSDILAMPGLYLCWLRALQGSRRWVWVMAAWTLAVTWAGHRLIPELINF